MKLILKIKAVIDGFNFTVFFLFVQIYQQLYRVINYCNREYLVCDCLCEKDLSFFLYTHLNTLIIKSNVFKFNSKYSKTIFIPFFNRKF